MIVNKEKVLNKRYGICNDINNKTNFRQYIAINFKL